MEYYDLTNTGPEVQERLDLVPITKADLDQEVLDRIEGDQRVLAESRAYCDLETARAMQVEANLQAQIDAIVGSRLTITVSKDVGIIYVGVPTTINFVIGTSMDVTSCKLMRGDVEVASSDVPGSNFTFADTLTVASDIGRVSYSVIAVLGGIERIQPVEIPVEKQTPAFAWNPAGDVTVTEGQYTPSDFPTLVNVPTGLTVVCSSTNPAVATVNSSGVVTVIGVGECTIKAESQATDVYKAKSVSYKLTIAAESVDFYWEVEGEMNDSLIYTFNPTDDYPTLKINNPSNRNLVYSAIAADGMRPINNYFFSVDTAINDQGEVTLPNQIYFGPHAATQNPYSFILTAKDSSNPSLSASITITCDYGTRQVAFTKGSGQFYEYTMQSPTESVIPENLAPKYKISDGGTINFAANSPRGMTEGYVKVEKNGVDANGNDILVFTALQSTLELPGGAYYGHNIPAGCVGISGFIQGNHKFYDKSIYCNLKIKPYVPATPDYYVGWSKGTSFDDFAAMTAEQLVALAEPYNKTAQPSITKTVTAEDVSGVTREVLFLMWKDGSAPTSGVFSSGGFVEQLSAQDFTNTDKFNATHADVVIDGETFHVSGIRLGFDVGDSLTVNFN